MSIFFPIGGAQEQAGVTFAGSADLVAVGTRRQRGPATLAGSSALAATPTVDARARARFAGSSALSATGRIEGTASAAFAGSAGLFATGRLNEAGNLFGSATLAGSSSLSATGTIFMRAGAVFAGSTVIEAEPTVEAVEEFGFTFYVNVIDAATQAFASGRIKRYTCRLLANGIEIPIRSARVSESSDRIGSSFSFTLARADVRQIALNAGLQFDVGFWSAGAWVWKTLLQGGRLASREHSIGYDSLRPTDTVTVNAIDFLGDRMARAPRVPTTLYDPAKIEIASDAAESEKITRYGSNTTITPVYSRRPGLRLRTVLTEAYVQGCGFAGLHTNLPDVPVSRADFTLEGGFDGGARPLVALFDPLYFLSDNNVLWLLDSNANVPAGFPATQLPLSAVVSLQDTIPAREPYSAILVSYRAEERARLTISEITETPAPTRSGNFGSNNFTETSVVRRIRRFFLDGELVNSILIDQTTTVRNHRLELIHRAVQSDRYDSFQRKIGHTRTVETMLPVLPGDGDYQLQLVARETNTTAYRVNPFNPKEMVQDISTTAIDGLIYFDRDNPYLDRQYELPATDAHRSGQISLDGDTGYRFGGLKTIIERLNIRGGGQLDVETTVIDHLSNTTERSTSAPRTGESAIPASRSTVTRRTLIELDTGDSAAGRRVPTLDVGDIPPSVALPLARKKLEVLNSPPRTATASLPFIDLSLRKGVIVRPHTRAVSAVLGNYIVTGRQLVFDELGTDRQRCGMTLELKEVKQ